MTGNQVKLMPPDKRGGMALTEALVRRRSVRSYQPVGITTGQLGQVLWAAQGLRDGENRTAPSAGAIYPLELYLTCGADGVIGQPPGTYRYHPGSHSLFHHSAEDARLHLSEAAYDQECIVLAPVVIIISAYFERITQRYGPRAERYVYLEAGHVGQNIALQVAVLGLGTVAVGAFDDRAAARALQLQAPIKPVYILPIGQPAE